jgi:hypothetical protein
MTGEQYDAPNQQVVRADGSAPWDEGTGGGEPPPEAPVEQPPPEAPVEPPVEPEQGKGSSSSKSSSSGKASSKGKG